MVVTATYDLIAGSCLYQNDNYKVVFAVQNINYSKIIWISIRQTHGDEYWQFYCDVKTFYFNEQKNNWI